MTLTPIEIIAIGFVVFSATKIAVMFIKPTAWYAGPAGKFWSVPAVAYPGIIALGAVVLWFLLQELTITQVLAAGVFGFLVYMLDMTPYTGKLFGTIQKDIESGTNILTKNWIGTLVWVGLMVWALWEIFVR
ncbi:MAG: hypothetical protein WD850_02785 [Candidatus Spechtbacterales bacterium]